MGGGRRRDSWIHVVERQPAGGNGHVPEPPLRLRAVSVAASRCGGPSRPLRASRGRTSRRHPAVRPLRRARRAPLLTASYFFAPTTQVLPRARGPASATL